MKLQSIKSSHKELALTAQELGIAGIGINPVDYILNSVVLPGNVTPVLMDRLHWTDSNLNPQLVRNMPSYRIKCIIVHLQSGKYEMSKVIYYMTVQNWIRVLKMELAMRKIREEYEMILIQFGKVERRVQALKKSTLLYDILLQEITAIETESARIRNLIEQRY